MLKDAANARHADAHHLRDGVSLFDLRRILFGRTHTTEKGRS